MKLEINTWTHHLNHLLYSFLYFSEFNNVKANIICNKNVKKGGAVLFVNNMTYFFDYSDDTKFLDDPKKFSFYFKRSLLINVQDKNVKPLNFNIPLSYKPILLISKLKLNLLFDNSSRTEVIRALDFFSFFTNSSHSVIDVRKYPKNIIDSGGKIIFHTRLWNPENHPDNEEKERRRLQNDFRINSCRIIKKNFKNASVGLFTDELSKKLAPDLLLSNTHSNKKNYLNSLKNHDIGIADDGLKDTPGWKIGEYLLYGKAVISTPINVKIDDFNQNKNYLSLSNRNSYQEIPDKIECLLKNKEYLQMAENNRNWSDIYLHPKNYIARILSVTDNIF